MIRQFPTAVTLLAVITAVTGCAALYSTKEVVRCEEARRPVTFESTAVAEKFVAAAKLNKAKQVGGTYTGVPFVTLHSTEQFLGENAKFNDAVVKCDNDQDGVITAQEVEAFGKLD
jgi:hypothetical protein